MLITAFVQVRPEGCWEPHNEVRFLRPAEHLVGFEPGTFQFSTFGVQKIIFASCLFSIL